MNGIIGDEVVLNVEQYAFMKLNSFISIMAVLFLSGCDSKDKNIGDLMFVDLQRIKIEIVNDKSKSDAETEVGSDLTLSAIGFYSDNSTQDLTDKVSWLSSNEQVAAFNGEQLETLTAGRTVVSASWQQLNSNQLAIDVTGSELSSLLIQGSELRINKGGSLALTVIATYADGTSNDVSEHVLWEIENTDLITIEDGVATGLEIGSTSVYAQFNEVVSPPVTLTVIEEKEINTSYLLDHWNQVIAADETILDNQGNADLSIKLADSGRALLSDMASDFSGGEIFSGRSLFHDDGSVDDVEMRSTFLDLQYIATLVALPQTSYFVNPEYKDAEIISRIVSALDYLLEHIYTIESQHAGNWWNWEIGANSSLINTLSLLKDDISAEFKKKAIAVSRYMSPEPHTIFASAGADPAREAEPSLGANRVDLVELSIVRAALDNDPNEIMATLESLYETFEYVESGDGFYADGSIIQHQDIPYNGGYGSVFLDGVARIQYAITNAGYITDPAHNDFLYQVIFNHFEPVLFKSQIIEGVRGRGSSRGWNNSRKEAQGVIQSLLMLYSIAPEAYKNKLGSFIKEQLLSPDDNRPQYHIEEFANLNVALYIANNELLNEPSIEQRGLLAGNFLFDSSDRVIHRKNDWLFSVSAFSDRIGNYECINGENLKGYNTANGMTYIYDTDQEQYVNYWPMFNPVLPVGTTGNVMDTPLDCSNDRTGENKAKSMQWVGGVSSRNKLDTEGSYGTFGMQFESFTGDLSIKKSWFMFDDEVVALGSDLTSSPASQIQTAVEFRKIQSTASNAIVIDGVSQSTGLQPLNYNGQPQWIFVAGDKSTSSRGYVFSSSQDVILQRSIGVNKTWEDINLFNASRMTNPKVSYNTVDIKLSHDTNKQYAYVLLPMTDQNKVKAYSELPDVEVKENTVNAQWVFEKTLNIHAANIWSEGGVSRSDFIVNKPASLMLQRGVDSSMTVWLASPVRSNRTVTLTLPTVTSSQRLSPQSDLSAITQISANQFEIDFTGLEGKTVMLHLQGD